MWHKYDSLYLYHIVKWNLHQKSSQLLVIQSNVPYFSAALAVMELLAILWCVTKYKLQNISGTHAVTWPKKISRRFILIGGKSPNLVTLLVVSSIGARKEKGGMQENIWWTF